MGIIYAIMTTQSGETVAQRRVGYLACTLFLNKRHDLSIMLVNTLQRDLKSLNYLDTCAALNALCYLDHLEMTDHLLEPTMKTMESPRQVVRKKGALALYWFYCRSPSLLDQIEPFLKAALLDKDISVVFVALEIWKKILLDNVEQYEDLLPTFLQIHQQILDRHIHHGYMYHGVLAPWAQITCLQIYGIYQQHDIGSQKDMFDFVVKCLSCMENKVDAAYAIILESTKLLSSMDTFLLSSLISVADNGDYSSNPFYILDPFLKANNHTMKYLGLTALAHLESIDLWHTDWKDGILLANILLSSIDDSVLAIKAISVLDICVTTEQILHHLRATMIQAIKQCIDGNTLGLVSRWFIDKVNDYVDNTSEWWIETMFMALAATGNRLDTNYVETQCHTLKQVLLDDIEDTELRTTAVNSSYTILTSHSKSGDLPPNLIQLTFWVLGENTYLSSNFTETDAMELLRKYIVLCQDDPLLQVCNLEAIKRCMLRSKHYVHGLESILRSEFLFSPIMEKQQVAREILMLLDNIDFVENIKADTGSTIPIKTRPGNQPTPPGKNGSSKQTELLVMAGGENKHQEEQWSERSDFITLGSRKRGQSHSINRSMMSSLIDMEMGDNTNLDDDKMTTDAFGKRWLSYQHEHKLQRTAPTSLSSSSSHYHQFFNDNINDAEKAIRWLQEQWGFDVVEVVGCECLATKKMDDSQYYPVLIHIKVDLPLIYITLRSLHSSTLYYFSQLLNL
ncbi:unnamed protein product [Absidia cylindrospora]